MSSHDDILSMGSLLVSRTYLYMLFHKIFGGEPTEELVQTLTSELTVDVIDEYADNSNTMRGGMLFLKEFAEHDRASVIDQAKDEYTRLFIGPDHLPASPWESPYVTKDPAIFQENTLVVRETFRAHGFLPKSYMRVPDDHISLLMHFLGGRAHTSVETFFSQDAAVLIAQLGDQLAFVQHHLNNWLSHYAIDARASKTAVLYPQMIEAAAEFCKLDEIFLGEALLWLEDNRSDTGILEVAPEAGVVFNRVIQACDKLASLRLPGLDENELERIDTKDIIVNEG